MRDSIIRKHIISLPPELRTEVLDFIDFLKSKYRKENHITEREFGYAKGKVKLSEDFDAPLEDFKEYY